MLDFSWAEMAVVAAVAIIVIGPRELPRVLRMIGQWVRRLRRMASEFQDSVDEMVREADLEDLRDQVEKSSPKRLQQEFVDSLDADVDDLMPNAGKGGKSKDSAVASSEASEPDRTPPETEPRRDAGSAADR